jgi:hypothetical protein
VDIDASAGAPRKPVTSQDTALACRAQLWLQNGPDRALAAARRGDVLGGEALPIWRLIELAGDFANFPPGGQSLSDS